MANSYVKYWRVLESLSIRPSKEYLEGVDHIKLGRDYYIPDYEIVRLALMLEIARLKKKSFRWCFTRCRNLSEKELKQLLSNPTALKDLK